MAASFEPVSDDAAGRQGLRCVPAEAPDPPEL